MNGKTEPLWVWLPFLHTKERFFAPSSTWGWELKSPFLTLPLFQLVIQILHPSGRLFLRSPSRAEGAAQKWHQTVVPWEAGTDLKMSLELISCHKAGFPHAVILLLYTSKVYQSAKSQSTQLTFLTLAAPSGPLSHEKHLFSMTLPVSYFSFPSSMAWLNKI